MRSIKRISIMADFKLTSEESLDTIMGLIKKHDIKYIRLIVVDLDGSPRAMLIPEYEMEYALRYGIGFDGSSIAGFRDVNDSDLIANPDPSTPHPHVGDPGDSSHVQLHLSSRRGAV